LQFSGGGDIESRRLLVFNVVAVGGSVIAYGNDSMGSTQKRSIMVSGGAARQANNRQPNLSDDAEFTEVLGLLAVAIDTRMRAEGVSPMQAIRDLEGLTPFLTSRLTAMKAASLLEELVAGVTSAPARTQPILPRNVSQLAAQREISSIELEPSVRLAIARRNAAQVHTDRISSRTV
jgi:hypothetical protein